MEGTTPISLLPAIPLLKHQGGKDTVKSSSDWTLGNNLENLILLSGANNGTGNGLVNTLTGNTGNNVLDGAGGADTLIGDAGNDTYIVDNSNEVITEFQLRAAVPILSCQQRHSN